MLTNERCFCCYQSQNYKIWKQFTTYEPHRATCNKLLSITKLQNLKAIHNSVERHLKIYLVVINHKTTKFESNSQRVLFKILLVTSCYQSQNYKIWKQFTTHMRFPAVVLWLLSITNYKIWKQFTTPVSLFFGVIKLLSIIKLQNLKAIHNSVWHVYQL